MCQQAPRPLAGSAVTDPGGLLSSALRGLSPTSGHRSRWTLQLSAAPPVSRGPAVTYSGGGSAATVCKVAQGKPSRALLERCATWPPWPGVPCTRVLFLPQNWASGPRPRIQMATVRIVRPSVQGDKWSPHTSTHLLGACLCSQRALFPRCFVATVGGALVSPVRPATLKERPPANSRPLLAKMQKGSRPL